MMKPNVVAAAVLTPLAGTVGLVSAYNCTVTRAADGDYTCVVGGTGATSGGVATSQCRMTASHGAAIGFSTHTNTDDNNKRFRFYDAAGVLALPGTVCIAVERIDGLTAV